MPSITNISAIILLCTSILDVNAFKFGVTRPSNHALVGRAEVLSGIQRSPTNLFNDTGDDTEVEERPPNPIETARNAAVSGNLLSPLGSLLKTFPSPALLSLSMITAILTSSSTFGYLTNTEHTLISTITTTLGTGIGLSVAVLFLIEAVKKGQKETEEDDNRY
ncbi:hypothetical protein TrLO_g5587 [Triparma laevis f. longispina]|uniref:Uncharacterized protein n=1 Tax=Triparma laevis f. longispina TaxID=1714387 RepID=A0A9W7E942_9STRA|nr:hypothetical protein TrLO_g5587 [Triparma laevis f. longispina]